MLERAAAIFEQCAIHRTVPPRLPLAATRRRRLKPTFWKHGAVEIELSEAWIALTKSAAGAGADAEREANASGARGRNVNAPPTQAYFTATGYDMQYVSLPRGILSRPMARRPPAVQLLDFKGTWRSSRLVSRAKPITSSSQSRTPDSKSPAHDVVCTRKREGALEDGGQRTTPPDQPATDGREELIGSDPSAQRWLRIQPPADEPGQSFPSPVSEYVSDLNKFDPWLLDADVDSLDKSLLLTAVHTNLVFGSHSRALECFCRCRQEMPADAPRALEHLVYFSFNSHSFPLLLESWRIWTRDGPALPRQPFPDSLHHLTRQSLPEILSSFWGELKRVRKDEIGTKYEGRSDYTELRSLLLSAMEMAVFKPCRPLLAAKFILILNKPTTYHSYIRHCITRGQTQHLASLYWMYYHRPRCNKDPTLFSLMMRHFLDQGKIAHAWVVHCDYCHYYYEAATPEDRRLLPMRDWWLEFAQEAVLQDFANGIAFSHVPFILPILKFRDLEMVDFAEQSLKSRVGIVPGNLEHYKNVWELCKVGKYQEAMAGSTSDAEGRSEGERNTGIDFVTLVLCMSAAARSNDLGTTLSLFNTAKNCGWHQSPLTLRPIIQVLGGHNLLKEAEIMCSTFFSTQRKRGPAKDDSFDSLVPNTMLDVYCEKGELAAAERLFNEMRRRGIPCDRQTWHHLARTFCRVRQVARAEALVMADSKCQRDPVIFEILMGGALLMHQFRRVHAYATKMKRRGLPLSIKAYSMMARATHRMNQKGPEPILLPGCETLLKHFSRDVELKKLVRQCGPSAPSVFVEGEEINLVAVTLAEVGDAAAMEQFETLLAQLDAHLAIRAKTSAMRFHLEKGNHDMVRSIWRDLFDTWVTMSQKAGKAGRPDEPPDPRGPAAPPRPPVGKEHALDVPFNLLRQVLEKENMPGELLQALNEVVGRGFLLGKRNWNLSIQMLARKGYWKEAFLLCETVLMPNWDGWDFMRALEISSIREKARATYESRKRRRRFGLNQWSAVPPHGEENVRQQKSSQLRFGQRRSFSTCRGPLLSQTSTSSRHVTRPRFAIHEQVPQQTRRRRPQERQLPLQLLQTLESTEKDSRKEYEAIKPLVHWYFQYVWRNRKDQRWQKFRKAAGTSTRLRPEVTQPMRHPHYLNPVPRTLFTLGRTYLDLSKSHWWDEGATEALRAIREMCPKTVAAVQELRYHPDQRIQIWFATTAIPLRQNYYVHPWTERDMREKIRVQLMPAYWALRRRFAVLQKLRAQRKDFNRLRLLPLRRMGRKMRPSLLRWVSLQKPSERTVRMSRDVLLWRHRSRMLEVARRAKEERRKRVFNDPQAINRLLSQILSTSTSERAKLRQPPPAPGPMSQAAQAGRAGPVEMRAKERAASKDEEEQVSGGLSALIEASQQQARPRYPGQGHAHSEWDMYKVADENNPSTEEESAALDEGEDDDWDEDEDEDEDENDEDALDAKARKKRRRDELQARLAKDKEIRQERKQKRVAASRRKKKKAEPVAPPGKGGGAKK